MTAQEQARGAEYYYSKGIGTGLAMAIELVEGIASLEVLAVLKDKMEDVCKKK